VLLIRRPPGGYVPGDWIFPGGRVDGADLDAPSGSLAPCECGRVLGLEDTAVARAACLAAVRELSEETGLLLARDRAGRMADAEAATALAVASREGASAWHAALESRGLVAAIDALAPFAHWVTPEGLPKRFDTWFFATRCPDGQEAAPFNETTGLRWIRPRDAVADNAPGGEITLPPPTLDALLRLAAVFDAGTTGDTAGIDGLLAAWARLGPPRVQRPVMLADGPDGPMVVLPGDPLHPETPNARPTTRYRFVLREGRFHRIRND
jgi:8-oxo-dGTP pyrophosphatase MutT (NUDIX family)